jgi:putative addiction module component (TIGR02574 family)
MLMKNSLQIHCFQEGTKMNTLEIKKMSKTERLQTMEALWNSLTEEESEIDSPEWHRDILEERKRNIENGKAEFISLEKLRETRKS